MSNKITVPLVKYNYALVGIALQLCPQRTRLTLWTACNHRHSPAAALQFGRSSD